MSIRVKNIIHLHGAVEENISTERFENTMSIVTLITDFDTKDWYSAMLKGAILRECPKVRLVDVTHQIPKYDLVRTATVLKGCWKAFPAGTIHVVTVNDLPKGATNFLLAKYENQYFICPDNGFLRLVFEKLPQEIYRIPTKGEASFPLINTVASAVRECCDNPDLSYFGTLVSNITERMTLHPVVSSNQLRGSVFYIDAYENVMVNIHRELFDSVRKEREFEVYFRRNNPLTKIEDFYFDVPTGQPFCRFNSLNYLEIAVNMGKAASLYNLHVDDTIQIDFL